MGKGFFVNTIKGTTDPKVECSLPKEPNGSYDKVLHKSRSNFIFRISPSTNFKISTKYQHLD